MNNKFLFSSLIVFVGMIFSITAIAISIPQVSETDDLNFSDSAWETLIIEQKDAVNAYNDLYNTLFEENSEGNITYPDTFSGAWIGEKGILYIALTELDSEVLQLYDKWLYEHDCIQYVQADYSLNELINIRDSIVNANKSSYNITSSYIVQSENKIIVETVDDISSVQRAITSSVSAQNVLTNMLNHNTEYDLNSTIMDFVEVRQGEKINTETQVYGGDSIYQIKSNGNVSYRTLGICGTIYIPTIGTYNGFITAGHEINLNDTSIFKKTGVTGNFGQVVHLNYSDGGFGDFALVKFTGSDEQTNKVYIDSNSSLGNIIGSVENLCENQGVYKYGDSSGITYGIVRAVDVIASDSDSGIATEGLTKCEIISGTSQGGDSGGPYFYPAASSLANSIFVGIHWGSSTNYMFFTPYELFDHLFTVKTN